MLDVVLVLLALAVPFGQDSSAAPRKPMGEPLAVFAGAWQGSAEGDPG
jgi:hypothetical protein